MRSLEFKLEALQCRLIRRVRPGLHGFLAKVLGKRISYSQLGEDIWIFQNFLNQPVHDAVLIEVGAFSGIQYSNTLLLEQLTRSSAILVEPAGPTFAECTMNRSNSKVYGFAVAEDFGLMELFGRSAVAGLKEFLTEDYLDQWNMHDAESREVVTIPFWALTRMEHLDFIDVLSIDVQGSELAVLKSADWNIPIGCICLELEEHDPERDDQCRQLLRDRGFQFRVRLGVSEIWTDPTYFRISELFDRKRRLPLARFLTPYLEPAWRFRIIEALSAN